VLYAWDPDEGFAFVDPASADGVVFSYQDEASFAMQWRATGRQMIEVWDPDARNEAGGREQQPEDPGAG